MLPLKCSLSVTRWSEEPNVRGKCADCGSLLLCLALSQGLKVRGERSCFSSVVRMVGGI